MLLQEDTIFNFKENEEKHFEYTISHVELCPDCGEPIQHTGHCKSCPSCGWSACEL